MEGPEIKFAEAVLDNGKFGKRTVRFETGRLAQQAQGAAAAYLDDETMAVAKVAGFYCCISKPIDRNTLVETISVGWADKQRGAVAGV